MSVKAGYVGKNNQHVVANLDDQVVVCAWTNHRTKATVYNSRNNTSGRIPVDLLEKEGSKPFIDTELYMATVGYPYVALGHVKWTRGDYIKVWNKVVKRYTIQGFCFSLATGEIGKFNCPLSSLEIIH
jgi:hypothetical protein